METPTKMQAVKGTPKSMYLTPRRRPLKVLSAVQNGARSAPYAYHGRYERQNMIRPSTPPTPTPQPRSTSKSKSLQTSHIVGDVAKASVVRQPVSQNDPMPFTLVERIHAKKVKYRFPSKEELALLHTTFPTAVTFRFEFPLVIIHCHQAPEQVPLTVGQVPAVFLADTDVYTPIPGTLGNPRNRDWLVDCLYDAENESEAEFCSRVLMVIKEHALSPTSVSLYLGALVVELEDHIPSYTLPGKLGGIVAYYCNGSPAWTARDIPQSRLITPEADTEDNSDYKSSGLCPGIRVCGHQYAGTSGLIVRNRTSGERRLIVANHVFKDTNDVYHPTTKVENYIGSITHRYPSLDIALVVLKDNVVYSNASYFDAPVPKQLLTSKYGGIAGQEWFFFDSPYTGLVPFLWTGVRVSIRDDLTGIYHSLKYDVQYTFLSLQVNVGCLPDGVCGSPLVHDETEDPESDGAVLGLFRRSDQDVVENLFVSVLDDLVEDGWILESPEGVTEPDAEMQEGDFSNRGETEEKDGG